MLILLKKILHTKVVAVAKLTIFKKKLSKKYKFQPILFFDKLRNFCLKEICFKLKFKMLKLKVLKIELLKLHSIFLCKFLYI